ncbi:MAG: patatin-like phospholipase family protein, partial [Salinivirgaceae bacterium]|nr:patatin-like phospholipase family protein [Salinivirgaceae bacterium]
QRIKSGHGITDEKYSANALEKALNDYFGDVRLSELLKPCLITAYDIRNRSAKFFNKLDTVSDVKDFYIKDIARATSAAPTYFETARINSVFGAPYTLVDGGVFANNPAMCAYAEARSINFATVTNNPEKPNCPSTDEIMILSIGTGSRETPYYYEKAKDWGVVGWIKPIIDILMSGNSETVDYQLRKIFC